MARKKPKRALTDACIKHLTNKKIADALDSSDSSSSDSEEDPVMQTLLEVTRKRNLNSRRPVAKTPANLEICIDWKEDRPDLFRQHARMDPQTFDRLVEQLEPMAVFHNDSGRGPQQMPMDRQVLIALERFGTHGNGASIQRVATWAGVGYGTVDIITRRVITAILSSDLQRSHVRWPGQGSEREHAKDWAHGQSGKEAWRGGWCMVDGTLIPLYQKPHWYGDTWFDRKSNYSMNVQIINTPNLKIIDYASGFVGSRHDTHCFAATRLAQEHDQLLAEDEWVWADVGFPIETWCMIPYKKPLSEIRENRIFNLNLSRIRIKSEHAIGYLKGRFQSLKELRIQIHGPEDVTFAMAWVNACIVLHSFCLDDELEVQRDWLDNGAAFEQWIREDRDPEMDEPAAMNPQTAAIRRVTLQQGKDVRECLKKKLLDSDVL